MTKIISVYICDNTQNKVLDPVSQGAPGSDGPPGRDGAAGVKVRDANLNLLQLEYTNSHHSQSSPCIHL